MGTGLAVATRITVKPVPGLETVADAGTKALTADRIKYLKGKIGSCGTDEFGKRRVQATRSRRASSPTVAQQIAATIACMIPEAAGCGMIEGATGL